MANVLAINDDDFETEVLKADGPVLVDFWAPWCAPCLVTTPIVAELAEEFAGRVKVTKLNVEENQKTPPLHKVRGIPAFILFKDGKSIGQLVGAVPKEKLAEFLSSNLE